MHSASPLKIQYSLISYQGLFCAVRTIWSGTYPGRAFCHLELYVIFPGKPKAREGFPCLGTDPDAGAEGLAPDGKGQGFGNGLDPLCYFLLVLSSIELFSFF